MLRLFPLALCLLLLLPTSSAHAFCGFFVAKADTKLFNKASKVVLVRDDDRTVLTMVNDYQGDPKEFAMVIPVPTVLKRKQINVGDNKIVEHLDRFTAPRLVEYHDRDPCSPVMAAESMRMMAPGSAGGAGRGFGGSSKGLGVTVEASYQVGEYDILILSAKESSGLQTWLKREGYKVPAKARPVLRSYLKQGLKFFVAKVNLERQQQGDSEFLRPLQVAYESERFQLPIRLGTVNAKGPQDLFIFALTKSGRVETTNYQVRKLPTGDEIPVFVKDDFGKFYTSMFDTLVKEDGMKKVYLEYAWDMGWCDPCAADPLSAKQLRELGVWWVKDRPQLSPGFSPRATGAQPVFVSRLHLRYTGKTFPQDLQLQVTGDKNNFQGRYVMRHPYTGDSKCEARELYEKELAKRQNREAKNLARLTGWDVNDIRRKMDIKAPAKKDDSWIDDLWR